MRNLRRPFYAVLLCALVAAACSLQLGTTPPASQPTQAPAQPATDTLVPVPTEASAPTATLEPVALAGPPMEVGSMWPYVDGSILVAVPGGPFTMGHGGSDNPEHQVTLSDFWIYQAKVTNQEFALCVSTGKCKAPDSVDDFTFGDLTHANDPVVGINYSQASDYCTFVHGRLPTEAEWEKTSRGPDGNIYPWGSNAPVCDFLNFNNCVGKITSVVTYPKGQSYYHALDTEGNVFEWVADWYDALYYKNSAAQDPLGPDQGQYRSVRSSSYKSKIDQIAASTRFFTSPKDHRRDLGFRCVVEDPGFFAPLCQQAGTVNNVATPDCPKVNIGLTGVCQKGQVIAVFTDTLSPDPDASVNQGSCSPSGSAPNTFPQIYTCTADTTLSIQTHCNYAAAEPVTCADHYKLDAGTGTCVWDGSLTTGNQCLPGFAYDPALQCCAAPAGKQTGYSVCPLGSALGYINGKPACIPNGQALANPSHTEFVHIQDVSSCTGGGNPGACTLNSDSCGKGVCRYGGGVFIPQTCSCYCPPG